MCGVEDLDTFIDGIGCTCMVVLMAKGSWLRGVFRMLMSAIETKIF